MCISGLCEISPTMELYCAIPPSFLALHFLKQYFIFITTTENLALQRYDVIERKAAQSNVETMNYLELVIHTVSYRYCCIFLKNLKYCVGSCEFTVASWSTSVLILKTADLGIPKVTFSQTFHTQSVIKTRPFHHFHVIYLFFLLYIYSHFITSSLALWLLDKISNFYPKFPNSNLFSIFLPGFLFKNPILIVSLFDTEILQASFAFMFLPLWTLNTPYFLILSFRCTQLFTKPHALAYFVDACYCFVLIEISTVLYLTGQCLHSFQTLALTSFSWCWQFLLCLTCLCQYHSEYLYRNTFKTYDNV